MEKGLIHLYVGDGKGKSTAAAGLAARMLARDKKVLYCQFLKGGDSGENRSLQKLGADFRQAKYGTKFTFQMNPEELAEAKKNHRDFFAQVKEAIAGGDIDLAVLDEVVDAVNVGFLTAEELVELANAKPESTELVFTGRNPDPAIEEVADYYTEFRCVKHPYQKGIAAREGIEH